MTFHRAIPRQQGFSMLEVLIAVLVFSLGIIGLAGLLIFAIQSNHVAYLRTQATFLAHNMADRMGANPAGLWNNDYNGNYPVTGSTSSCVASRGTAGDVRHAAVEHPAHHVPAERARQHQLHHEWHRLHAQCRADRHASAVCRHLHHDAHLE
jgi:type IV pilus modification protein PilV